MFFLKKYFYLFFILIFLSFSNYAMADFDFTKNSGLSDVAIKTGHISEQTSLDFDPSESISLQAGMIIQLVLSFVGVIFMILLVYGGVLWMTAHGNDQQVEKAKKIITESILGLAIVVSAYAISVLIISNFNFQ